MLRVPLAVGAQQFAEGLCIRGQVRGKRFLEQRGANPLEALLVFGGVLLISRFGARHAVGCSVFLGHRLDQSIEQIFRFTLHAFSVFIHVLEIEQPCIKDAHGQIQSVLDGVEINLVAQNVPVNRLQERKARGFQAV